MVKVDFEVSYKLMQSTYKIGLSYEKLTLAVLRGHKFYLKHTGGPGDGGQDFTGYWSLPEKNIPVVGTTPPI